MTNIDFNLLRQCIATASRATFNAVRAAHPEETFYTMALYTHDDVGGINPSMNSEQAYQRGAARMMADEKHLKWLESQRISVKDTLLGDERWSPYDWDYECDECERFESVSEIIYGKADHFFEEGLEEQFVSFKAGVFAAMVLALRDLDKEGLFGTGPARDSFTVFCSVADSECAPWFEEDSARRLNSSKVFETFARERIKWINDEPDDDPPPDDVRDLYLSILEKG